MGYDAWLLHYQRNPQRHARLEDTLDWRRQSPLVGADRAAIARSLQRFELGESGDGVSLLAKAGRAQDPTYVAALELFVIEEQKHSELFRRALEYLQYPTLASHWSDAAFVRLRRALGLRLELTLFLVAEVVALHYFAALRDGVPDRNLRAMAVLILADEEEHVHFQVQRLAEGFARTPGLGRAFVRATWWALATGAAIVVAVDHGKALRVCGVRRASFVRRALRSFRGVVTDVFNTDGPGVSGPVSASRADVVTRA
jgi:hypothetical protein